MKCQNTLESTWILEYSVSRIFSLQTNDENEDMKLRPNCRSFALWLFPFCDFSHENKREQESGESHRMQQTSLSAELKRGHRKSQSSVLKRLKFAENALKFIIPFRCLKAHYVNVVVIIIIIIIISMLPILPRSRIYLIIIPTKMAGNWLRQRYLRYYN